MSLAGGLVVEAHGAGRVVDLFARRGPLEDLVERGLVLGEAEVVKAQGKQGRDTSFDSSVFPSRHSITAP